MKQSIYAIRMTYSAAATRHARPPTHSRVKGQGYRDCCVIFVHTNLPHFALGFIVIYRHITFADIEYHYFHLPNLSLSVVNFATYRRSLAFALPLRFTSVRCDRVLSDTRATYRHNTLKRCITSQSDTPEVSALFFFVYDSDCASQFCVLIGCFWRCVP